MINHQVDRNPHPSVQPWSRGPIFPGVIARVETWSKGLAGVYFTEYELAYPGQEPQRYRTYADAEQQARGLNRAGELKRAYRERRPNIVAAWGASEIPQFLRLGGNAEIEHSKHYFDTDRNKAPDSTGIEMWSVRDLAGFLLAAQKPPLDERRSRFNDSGMYRRKRHGTIKDRK